MHLWNLVVGKPGTIVVDEILSAMVELSSSGVESTQLDWFCYLEDISPLILSKPVSTNTPLEPFFSSLPTQEKFPERPSEQKEKGSSGGVCWGRVVITRSRCMDC